MATASTRQERGLALSKSGRIRHVSGDKWLVPSASGAGQYVVDASERSCTCPDFEERRCQCKHQWALSYARHEVRKADGTVTVTETVRITYGQNLGAYNAAQRHEREHVERLLGDLCLGAVTPPHPGRGPKPIPIADLVYGMAMKVYTGFSARRADSDIRALAAKKKMSRAPSPSSVLAAFDRPEMEALLTRMIEDSAAPLASVERAFAVDSTGFGTSVYRRWYDAKYGKEMKEHAWLKAHAMVGTTTNVITAIRVTDGTAGDSPELPGLVQATDRHFTLAEVSGDKAYLAHENLAAIEAAGAVPYVPFKINSVQGEAGTAWRRMFGLFLFRQVEFLAHYHRRSNVESTFSALKRLLGGSLRSRTFVAQKNELLCKVLLFNLITLVHAIYELGIDPKLGAIQ
jgi:transposase